MSGGGVLGGPLTIGDLEVVAILILRSNVVLVANCTRLEF